MTSQRIAFRTDANDEIGTGHFMRCLTLADALKKHGAQNIKERWTIALRAALEHHPDRLKPADKEACSSLMVRRLRCCMVSGLENESDEGWDVKSKCVMAPTSPPDA